MADRDGLYPEPVAAGFCGAVLMTCRVFDAYSAWPMQQRFALLRIMQIIAENGHRDLNKTQFTSEERMRPRGQTNGVQVYAVKDDRFRLYGCFEGNRFVCTAFDEKKQRKADRNVLQQAADRFAECRGGIV